MMFVNASGQKYRIQIVHSAHDLKQSRASENPGGLRMVADNLAASLHRRVSLVEIARVEEIPTGTKRNPTVETTFVPLSIGFSVCNPQDQFVKSEGRERALIKALNISRLPRKVQEEIVSELFEDGGTLAELKEKYQNK